MPVDISSCSVGFAGISFHPPHFMHFVYNGTRTLLGSPTWESRVRERFPQPSRPTSVRVPAVPATGWVCPPSIGGRDRIGDGRCPGGALCHERTAALRGRHHRTRGADGSRTSLTEAHLRTSFRLGATGGTRPLPGNLQAGMRRDALPLFVFSSWLTCVDGCRPRPRDFGRRRRTRCSVFHAANTGTAYWPTPSGGDTRSGRSCHRDRALVRGLSDHSAHVSNPG
jgi:hypothetical protein